MGGATALAGCLSFASGPEQTRLRCLEVSNNHADSHTLHVRVTSDGEVVHRSTHELRSRMGPRIAVNQTWPNESGQYSVSARLDNRSEWVRTNLTQDQTEDGHHIIVEINSYDSETTSERATPEIMLWDSENPKETCEDEV